MLVLQIVILGILLIAVPMFVGSLFVAGDKCKTKPLFGWISGQMLLWAGFQCICVPLVLRQERFGVVKQCFLVYTAVLLCVAFVVWIYRRRKEKSRLHLVAEREKRTKGSYVCWGVFLALLLLQVVLAGVLAYEEVDDAFYVGISTITEQSDTMYCILPYTGGSTGLDARHGLAPFPVWVSFLAVISGMPSVTVAQVALPMVLIVMTYGIYYLLGRELLGKKENMLPLFMVLVAVLILFGGYSVYSAENFMLVRTAQGKAVLANIIIPFLLLLSWRILENIHRNEKIGVRNWLLLALTMTAGCLCSTLGAFLTCMLLGIVGICTAVSYRRWKFLIPMAATGIVPMMFVVLYLLTE
uniref:DUF6077 domain-containing protein n=1 Tax=Acetatifactor sp. TaxID=1872090 RepID=UPI0040559E37